VNASKDAAAAESPVVDALRARLGDGVLGVEQNRGQWRLLLERDLLVDAVTALQADAELGFDFLVDETALDHFGDEPRFSVVYVLRSMKRREEVVLKVRVPEDDCWAPSLTGLYKAALLLEREVYDMFGIDFPGHPDLRRVLMPEMFQDFPLRKDFPMEGKMSDREWAEWIITRAQRLEGGE